jgi:rare lipoprotein A
MELSRPDSGSTQVSVDRLTLMVRWTGLLLAYLALPLAGLTLSEASAGELGEIGLASYYSQGGRTASGEPFDTNALSGAHRTVSFGTRVRVTVLKTDKHVIVRINDRGPFIRGRVVDVFRDAQRKFSAWPAAA